MHTLLLPPPYPLPLPFCVHSIFNPVQLLFFRVVAAGIVLAVLAVLFHVLTHCEGGIGGSRWRGDGGGWCGDSDGMVVVVMMQSDASRDMCVDM